MRLSEKISVIGVIVTIWMLALACIPKLMQSQESSSITYYAVEFGLMFFLGISIGIWFISKSGIWYSSIRFLAFSISVWFGWAMITKIKMLQTGVYVYRGFAQTDLSDKIQLSLSAGFVMTILYELWKHRKSLT